MLSPSATSLALLRLLADGDWHSGVRLAERVGVSRAAVCKQIQGLARWGVAVQTQRPGGYRLDPPLHLLDRARLEQELARCDGSPEVLEIFDSLPSTNGYLTARIAQGESVGACLAEHQSAGRGRRGRVWQSPFARNVYLSLAHRYEVGPAALAGLSLAVGVALAQLITARGVPGVGLKWPNDLLCDGHKLGGILIELQGETQGPCWVVAGVGINVNMQEADGAAIDQAWTSLARISGEHWDRNVLAAQLTGAVRRVLARFPREGLGPWLAAYARFDTLADHPVHVDWAGERLAGVARGVDANGALLLDCAGHRRSVWGGEVTVRAGFGPSI
ncbi:MAG: biotin--[acetyl-CoA-carboxylase] ligase [Immundisolibacter sp.]|uniref:biotin--[acetyl-CoA-carboxylase] ligase n=1 Tax=Immundisolibacter sp. TaxID=1934948 RepID=UPI003EDF5794